MFDLPLWKRALAVAGLAIASLWLLAMALQSITIECAPGAGQVACVHEVHYAIITTKRTAFAPTADNVSSRRGGKYNRDGTIVIKTPSGDTVTVGWLSADDAEVYAKDLVRDPNFTLKVTGPRWWLVFLLGTIPLMLSFIVPRKAVASIAPSLLKQAPPVEQTKKAARAARGRKRKARDLS